MPSTVTDSEALITREQLRTFHIAGRGLEFAVPAGPLRPVSLDQLQQLPPFETGDLRPLYESSLTASRCEARKAFLEKIKQARARLEELLALDDVRAPEAGSAKVVSASLGHEGGVFFDA